MTDYIKKLADLHRATKEMRLVQSLYFQRIGKAKKSKKPEDFAQAKVTLKLSCELESTVDKIIAELDKMPVI